MRSHAILLLVLCSVVLSSPGIALSAETTASQALGQLVEDFERSELANDPIQAGREGDLEALARWQDASMDAVSRRRTESQDFLDRLQAIDAAGLNDDERINYIVLEYLLGSRVELAPFEQERMPFTSDSGFFSLPLQIGRSTRIGNLDQAEAWLERIRALPQWIDQNRAWLVRGIETGMVQPEYVVQSVIGQLRSISNASAEDSPLLAPFRTLPAALEQAHGNDFRNRAIALIEEHAEPAFASLLAFYTDDYLAQPRTSIGISEVPQGRALYRALVRYHTTLETTPAAIHQRGLQEVARIRQEMDAVIAETGFQGSFAEFVADLRTNPRFYAGSERELLMHAAWIAKRADDAMPGLFATLPRLPYGVRPVPAELAPTYTTGRYWAGDLDNGVAGGYMVNTHRLDQRPLHVLPA